MSDQAEAIQDDVSVEEVLVEENAEQNEENTEEVVADAAPTEEQQEALQKYLLKIDGKEIETEFDHNNKDEVTKILQLAKVSQIRMQEASEANKSAAAKDAEIAEIKSDVQAFMLGLKNDPVSILSDQALGIDVRELTKILASHQIQESEKSPEVKAREESEKRTKFLEDKLKEAEEEKRVERDERLKNQMAAEMESEIQEAIKNNDLPEDAIAIKRVAQAMRTAFRYNIDVSVAEIVPLVKQQMFNEAKRQLGLLKEDEIEEFVGKEKLENIRKKYLKGLRKSVPSANSIKNSSSAEEEKVKELDIFGKKDKTKIKSKDFFKKLQKDFS